MSNHLAYLTCATCGTLNDSHYAFQKYGWEKDNSYLPAAANRLVLVHDLRPYSGRALQLQQCPECHTYYLYQTDYEYLVNGSEDEQFLTRLTAEDAAAYLPPVQPA